MSDTVGSLADGLINEDSGIEVVTFYTSGFQFYLFKNAKFCFEEGLRISKSTRVQHLLTFPTFYLRINDTYYKFELDSSFDALNNDKVASLGDIQSKVYC